MIDYIIHTSSSEVIRTKVEGHHVAAALDQILTAKRCGKALMVPHLPEQICQLLASMKALTVLTAAKDGGCLPSMVLAALWRIGTQARRYYGKHLRFTAAQEAKNARKVAKQATAGASGIVVAHGEVDQETAIRPVEDDILVKAKPKRARLAKRGKC